MQNRKVLRRFSFSFHTFLFFAFTSPSFSYLRHCSEWCEWERVGVAHISQRQNGWKKNEKNSRKKSLFTEENDKKELFVCGNDVGGGFMRGWIFAWGWWRGLLEIFENDVSEKIEKMQRIENWKKSWEDFSQFFPHFFLSPSSSCLWQGRRCAWSTD